MVIHDPLHGSGRAGFPHPALALGNNAQTAQGIRMKDTDRRQPAADEPPHPVPEDSTVLAPPRTARTPEGASCRDAAPVGTSGIAPSVPPRTVRHPISPGIPARCLG